MTTTSINNHHSPRQERRFARLLYIGLGLIVLVCFVYVLFKTRSTTPQPSTETIPIEAPTPQEAVSN